MRKRLRDLPDLDATYPAPHDHRIYGEGHGHRVRATIELMQRALPVNSVADLSCGNAVIPRAAQAPVTVLGDYAPGYEYTGRLEDNLPLIPEVDLYVCSETLEHVEDPDLVLDLIAEKARALVLSTPIGAWGDTNGEHLWAWDRVGIEGSLEGSGFTVEAFTNVDAFTLYNESYNYGIWIARRR